MITGENSIMFRRGEVVLARYPFTDLSAAKARPALIVSGETYHRYLL